VSLPWPDPDGLFAAGEDYAVVASPQELTATVARLCADDAARARIARSGRERVLARHTCGHRADELVAMLS
jgi:spore maturation protein CgeB